MAGMGASFLSLRTVRRELASGYMALMDGKGLPPVGHWYVAHLPQRKLSPAAKSLKNFLIKQGEPLIESWALGSRRLKSLSKADVFCKISELSLWSLFSIFALIPR